MKYDLIFYDETCPLCICCVNFIAKRDKKNQFRFAPLTSEKAQKLTHTRENTLIFLERNQKEKIRSKAALRILYLLGYPWKLLGFLYHLPSWLIDPPYRLIARLRKRGDVSIDSDQFLT